MSQSSVPHHWPRDRKSASSKFCPRPDCDSRPGGRWFQPAPGRVRLGKRNGIPKFWGSCRPYATWWNFCFVFCYAGARVHGRRSSANSKSYTAPQCSSAQPTPTSKHNIGKGKRRLVTKTTDKKRPTIVLQRKSLLLAWSRQTLKSYIRRYRSRCRQHWDTGIARKRRQTKLGDKSVMKSVPAASNGLSLIHIWRCRRIERCRSRWSPYH